MLDLKFPWRPQRRGQQAVGEGVIDEALAGAVPPERPLDGDRDVAEVTEGGGEVGDGGRGGRFASFTDRADEILEVIGRPRFGERARLQCQQRLRMRVDPFAGRADPAFIAFNEDATSSGLLGRTTQGTGFGQHLLQQLC